jgi:hypothetical protein
MTDQLYQSVFDCPLCGEPLWETLDQQHAECKAEGCGYVYNSNPDTALGTGK